ncbi:MAG: hypothetical protein ACKV2V_09525 [Blastocatellia bacterium]
MSEILISADRPLALAPVRLETRFFGSELWIRVYPDKAHVDTHEPALTADEVKWGRHFYEMTWRAATDEARAKAAWAQLAERYGANRAWWIVRRLKPGNDAARPQSPIPADQPLATPPQFPDEVIRPEALKAEAWTRAPLSRVLPDRWIAKVFLGGQVFAAVTGNPIPDPLPVGPNPQADIPAALDQLPVDAGMKWMIDFAEAERLGMAMKLRLPDNWRPDIRLERLIVYGVRKSLDSGASTARLNELIQAHTYTDGLALLAQGTPTNNTPQTASGFDTADPANENSYNMIFRSPLFAAGDGSNGDTLTRALGLAPDALQSAPRAAQAEQTDAMHMQRALWPATWGYFLEQMITRNNPPVRGLIEDNDLDAAVTWARDHYLSFVRAGGPLPALRLGKQPYGVLPVTALATWKPAAADGPAPTRDSALVDLLRHLRTHWLRYSFQAPFIGRTTENPEVDFASVLQREALSSSYSLQNVFGEQYQAHLWPFAGQTLSLPMQNKRTEFGVQALRMLAGIGDWMRGARLDSVIYYHARQDINPDKTPLVQAGSDTALSPNYLDTLLGAQNLADVRNNTTASPSLLYRLLRHAMLLEYAGAAARKLGLAPTARREPELVGFTNAPVTTPLQQIERAALHQAPAFASPADTRLREFRDSLTYLKTLPADRLAILLRGALDTAAYRLDAWITATAAKRLAAMRRASPAGIYLGAYGWVENLTPGPARQTLPTPPGAPPVTVIPGNPGYVHAPSLDQAATVAVLRNGHLTYGDPANRHLLSIDLSSERVRLVEWLLEGVRNGQSLSALLGYRFERGLHENTAGLPLDQYIEKLRTMAPIESVRIDAAGQPLETVPANHVVDGVLLFRLSRAIPERVISQLGAIPDNHKAAISAEIARIGNAMDAVSDALVAESVHQVVRGNPSRAAATLDALERGEAPPPALEVTRTPRSGAGLTHRLVVLLNTTATTTPQWPDSATSPRALALPCLNAWAARLLGNPANVRCVVERVEAETGNVVDKREFRFNALRLSPLDVLQTGEAGEDTRQSELEQRMLLNATRMTNGFAPRALDAPATFLRVNPARDPAWPLTELSWREFSELARSVRRLVNGARALEPGDVIQGQIPDNSGVDLDGLVTRANRAAQTFRQALSALRTRIAGPATDAPDLLRDAMLKLAQYGIPGAIPLDPVGAPQADREALLNQARSLEKEATERLARITEKETAINAPTATRDDKLRLQVERLRETLGPGTLVVTRFTATNAAELGQAIAASDQTQEGDPMAVITWCQRAARVREAVARLEDTLGYAEALNTGDSLTLQVAQLPFQTGDRWIGLPLRNGQPPAGGKLSLVAHSPLPIDFTKPISGLLIDEWVEVVPGATETTGVVFQYNQPDTTAPQAILLAVPPDMSQPAWTGDMLEQVLLETMDLMRIRAVTPDMLGELGQYLPALYFAFNAAGETVSTDFVR